MSKYLQKSLICLLLFAMPYMNLSLKATGTEDDEGFIIRTHQVRPVAEDQKDVTSSLGGPQISWRSYISSSLISGVQEASRVLNYVTRDPQKAMIIGLFIANQVLAVEAGAACYCYNNGPKFYGFCVADMAGCNADCGGLGFPGFYIVDKDKGC